MKPAEKWFVGLPGARLRPLSVAVTVDDIRAIQRDAMEAAATIADDQAEPVIAAQIRASVALSEKYAEHVHCSNCGKRVSGTDPEMGLVVRAYVECPECVGKSANLRAIRS